MSLPPAARTYPHLQPPRRLFPLSLSGKLQASAPRLPCMLDRLTTCMHACRFDVDADVGLRVGLNLSGVQSNNFWKASSLSLSLFLDHATPPLHAAAHPPHPTHPTFRTPLSVSNLLPNPNPMPETQVGCNKDVFPMWAAKVLAMGHLVGRVEEVGSSKDSKTGLVKRRLVKIYTPSTAQEAVRSRRNRQGWAGRAGRAGRKGNWQKKEGSTCTLRFHTTHPPPLLAPFLHPSSHTFLPPSSHTFLPPSSHTFLPPSSHTFHLTQGLGDDSAPDGPQPLLCISEGPGSWLGCCLLDMALGTLSVGSFQVGSHETK